MAKKVHHVPLVALGRHHHWSRDGHDKLVKIGFPVWGIQDMWMDKWLGLWTIPDNWLKVVIAYLYLSLVVELGGDPFYDHLMDILLIMYVKCRKIDRVNSRNSGHQVQTYKMLEGASASAYVLHPFQTLVPRFRTGRLEDWRLEDQREGQSCSQSGTLEDENQGENLFDI